MELYFYNKIKNYKELFKEMIHKYFKSIDIFLIKLAIILIPLGIYKGVDYFKANLNSGTELPNIVAKIVVQTPQLVMVNVMVARSPGQNRTRLSLCGSRNA